MASDNNKYRKAHKVVERYYGQLVSEISDEVLRRQKEFSQVNFSAAEDLLDGFARRLAHVSQVAQHLDAAARSREVRPQPPMLLAEVACGDGDVAEAVNGWLRENPACTPVSFSTVAGLRDMRCFILYRTGTDTSTQTTRGRPL